MAPLARRDFVMRMCPEVILSSFYVEKHTYLSEWHCDEKYAEK